MSEISFIFFLDLNHQKPSQSTTKPPSIITKIKDLVSMTNQTTTLVYFLKKLVSS